MRTLFAPTERAERLIAAGRLFLALSSLIAIWSDPTTPARWQGITYSLLAGYTIYAAAVAVVALRRPLVTRRARIVSHVFDLTIFSAFIYLTEGPVSPFFLYFVFSVFCATLRFQAKGLIATALAALGIYVGIGVWGSSMVDMPEFEADRFLIRCVYLLVVAALLYYLQSYQRRLGHELAALAEWPREIPSTFDELILESLEGTRELLRSDRVALVLEDADEPLVMIAEAFGDDFRIERRSVSAFDSAVVSQLLHASFVVSKGILRTPGAGEIQANVSDVLRPPLMSRWNPASLISVPFASESVSGRLFAIDPPDATGDDLTLATLIARIIASRFDQYRLLESIRVAASGEERLRISRDLHDGVLQSLSGVALRVHALQSEIEQRPSSARASAVEILRILEENQREIRGMVRGLSAEQQRNGDPELAARLEALRERMLAEWSLHVDLSGVPANERVGSIRSDLTHIIGEAAVNARKHGGASRVRVRFEEADGALTVRISDNGSGFPFRGRRSADELRDEQTGPRSLMERVQSLGGSLEIDSEPGGATLDIRFHQAGAQ